MSSSSSSSGDGVPIAGEDFSWETYFEYALDDLAVDDRSGACQYIHYFDYNGIRRRRRAASGVITRNNQTADISLELRWGDQFKLQEAIVWLLHDESIVAYPFPDMLNQDRRFVAFALRDSVLFTFSGFSDRFSPVTKALVTNLLQIIDNEERPHETPELRNEMAQVNRIFALRSSHNIHEIPVGLSRDARLAWFAGQLHRDVRHSSLYLTGFPKPPPTLWSDPSAFHLPGDPDASDTDDDHSIDFNAAPNKIFRGFRSDYYGSSSEDAESDDSNSSSSPEEPASDGSSTTWSNPMPEEPSSDDSSTWSNPMPGENSWNS